MTELSSIMPMKSFETEDTAHSQKGSITTRDLIIYQNTDPCLKQCPTNDFRFEGPIGNPRNFRELCQQSVSTPTFFVGFQTLDSIKVELANGQHSKKLGVTLKNPNEIKVKIPPGL